MTKPDGAAPLHDAIAFAGLRGGHCAALIRRIAHLDGWTATITPHSARGWAPEPGLDFLDAEQADWRTIETADGRSITVGLGLHFARDRFRNRIWLAGMVTRAPGLPVPEVWWRIGGFGGGLGGVEHMVRGATDGPSRYGVVTDEYLIQSHTETVTVRR